MNPRITAGVAALAILAAPLAWGQAPVTLAEAVEAAWRRAAALAEAAGQSRRAEAERPAASSLWAGPPAAEVGITRDRQRATGSSRETEAGLAVPLWLPGQRIARLQEVDAQVNAAAASSGAARLRVAGAVREAISEVELQRAEVAAAQVQLRDMQALAQDVDRRVAAGDLARADAMAAHAERLAAANALAQARQRLQAAERHWFALTGLKSWPTLPAEAAEAARGADAPLPAQEHPALRAAALKVEAARQRVQVARASRREAPELSVRARQESATGERSILGLGVALRIPFATAERNAPLMAAALSELESAEAAERELREEVEAARETARLAQSSARQQLADETARAQLLRERATLIDKSFQAGQTALPEMLRALHAATQAEAAVGRARAALAQATSRLQQAHGVMP